MPMLRLPVRGSRVCTQGSVMKRPPSCGQHLRIGKKLRSKLSAANDLFAGRVFGARRSSEMRLLSSPSCGSIFSLSKSPAGGFMFIRPVIRSAIWSIRSTPSAIAMRRSLPNWLISTLWPGWPATFSKSSAGPPGAYSDRICRLLRPAASCEPILLTRSVISVISSSGRNLLADASQLPCFFRVLIQSRRSS